VSLAPNLEGVAVADGLVTLRHVYSEELEQRGGVDLIVVAGRRTSMTALRDDLRRADPTVPLIVVGDALAPRTLLDAVSEGARAGAAVEAGTPAAVHNARGHVT
jgi:N,N-dimethylglycine/sarcosine dehydrogenase